jgi:lipopolysaccharide biosynthesis glycosyltransferase
LHGSVSFKEIINDLEVTLKEINSPIFFTIVAKNYIPYARTLCQSIKRHYPEAKIYLGLSDRQGENIDSNSDEYEILTVDQLDLPNPDQFAFRYDVTEFSTAIKPYIFQWIFNNTLADSAIYLDPDILVLAPLKKVFNLLDRGATAVLTPHFTARVNDDGNPNEITMLRVGSYNLGFIGLSGRRGSAPD